MKLSGKFSIRIIAFGTHLSKFHGYTISEIKEAGIRDIDTITSILTSDTENAIATSSALTAMKFSDYWEQRANAYDWVLCLGDRFEMSAAVFAAVPYEIKFAHFYGGDYSPGAIDNVYRNCLTHCSSIHFTSTATCAERVANMVPKDQPIEVVGIMSLEETLNNSVLLTKEDFFEKWKISFERPTILATVHPETVSPKINEKYALELESALKALAKEFHLVITMPNSDTNGILYRHVYKRVHSEYSQSVSLIENFGLQSYFSCLAYADVVLGNSSSGITEAASFGKYVVNVGNRQKGRAFGENIISVKFDRKEIVENIQKAISLGQYTGSNIYCKPNSLDLIMKTILDA